MLINDEKKMIFYRCPKTGCKTISQLLLYKDGWREAIKMHPEISKHTCNIYHCKQQYINQIPELKEKYESYESFCVARNPWGRMLSAYLYAMEITGKRISSIGKYECSSENYKWAEKTHDKLVSYGFLRSIKENVLDDPDYIGECCTWMDKGRWFKLENLEELEKYLNIKIDIKINSTNHMHYSRYYDDEVKEIITNSYKNDIAKFNYFY